MDYIHDMNLRKFDLNLLVILDTLLSERSVTQASKHLYITQPAVSNALRRLRIAFNDLLLIRGKSHMELTVRAKSLIKPVRDALSTIDHAMSGDIVFNPSIAEFTLHMAATEYVSFMLLPALMKEIRKAAPRVRFAISDIESHDCLEPLRRGMVDLIVAFVSDPVGELHRQVLLRDTWVYLVSRDCYGSNARLTRKRFLASGHIAMKSQTGGSGFYVDTLRAEWGLERNIVMSIPHFLAIPRLVSTTDLVMAVPHKLALTLVDQYPLRIVKPPVSVPEFTISMLWHQRTEADPGQRWIRNTLARVAKSL